MNERVKYTKTVTYEYSFDIIFHPITNLWSVYNDDGDIIGGPFKNKLMAHNYLDNYGERNHLEKEEVAYTETKEVEVKE